MEDIRAAIRRLKIDGDVAKMLIEIVEADELVETGFHLKRGPRTDDIIITNRSIIYVNVDRSKTGLLEGIFASGGLWDFFSDMSKKPSVSMLNIPLRDIGDVEISDEHYQKIRIKSKTRRVLAELAYYGSLKSKEFIDRYQAINKAWAGYLAQTGQKRDTIIAASAPQEERCECDCQEWSVGKCGLCYRRVCADHGRSFVGRRFCPRDIVRARVLYG